MTKPLLSQLDIKMFILNTINEVLVEDIILNRTQLCRTLHICNNAVDEYKLDGMPSEEKFGKTVYRLKDVIRWLDSHGKKYSYGKI